ncbi:hypothetical protein [Rubritalea sp.]|uniref:hypothetical protein n=1 Tax=Rubritalea sp. TaxID=2109375 RepID=UPI003EF0F1DE
MSDINPFLAAVDRLIWLGVGAGATYFIRNISQNKTSAKVTLESAIDKLLESCEKCRAAVIRHHDCDYGSDAKTDLKVIQRYKDAAFSKFKAVLCCLKKSEVDRFEGEYYKWMNGVSSYPLATNKGHKKDPELYLNQVNNPHEAYSEFLHLFKMKVSQGKVKVRRSI